MAATQNFSFIRGDTWKYRAMVHMEDGRFINDGVIDSGDLTTLLSSSAKFNSGDIGHLVSTKTGAVIIDGTTIDAVAVDGKSCTLSIPATGPVTKQGVLIRAADMTDYTVRAQVRNSAETPTVAYVLSINTDREEFGVYLLSLTAAQTASVSGGVYDFEVTDSLGEVSTLFGGSISITPDVTKS